MLIYIGAIVILFLFGILPMFIAILFIGGAQLVSLGIIGE